MIRFSHEANSWMVQHKIGCNYITPQQAREYFDKGYVLVID